MKIVQITRSFQYFHHHCRHSALLHEMSLNSYAIKMENFLGNRSLMNFLLALGYNPNTQYCKLVTSELNRGF